MTARFLSIIASEMISVAVGWQIYGLTHRPLDLGLVGLAQFSPGVLLFLVAGHTADRHSRQSILRICYGGFALCAVVLLALAFRGLASVWPIYAVLLANGAVRAFNGPASQSFLPQLVKPEHFPNAVTWGSSFFQTATILGPMAGGLIYGFAGSPVPVYGCATIAYLVAVFLLSAIRVEIAPRRNSDEPVGMILDGLRYIWRNKLILGCMSLDLFAVLLGGAVALLPVYAREILRTGPYGLGVLRAAPGLGAVTVAILLAHYPLRRRAGLSMLFCVGGFGVLDHCLRAIAQSCALAACADTDWRVRYGQRDCALHSGSAHHARRNARPGERGEHAIHRSVQRSGPIRIGNHGAVVRCGSGGGIGWRGDHRDRAGVELAVSGVAPGRQVSERE